MLGSLLQISFPVVVLTAVLFVAVRLQLFSHKSISGRIPLLIGGGLLVIMSVWQVVKGGKGFEEWFLPSVYPYLSLTQALAFVLGLGLLAVGISRYAAFWRERQESLETRERNLSILHDLQRDARQPHQVLDLLAAAIKDIVVHVPESAGAIFLLNRSRRQFVLASGVGLTKEETAALEYYPLERNLVSQAVDLGEPMLAGAFDFPDRSGAVIGTRFRSCLVLPLISGQEKLGGIVLLSEQHRRFGRIELHCLVPVAEWLSEKIKSARLIRELSEAKNESQRYQESHTALTNRLLSVTQAASAAEPLTAFCGGLVGMAASESVHFVALMDGVLRSPGGSEPWEVPSDSYRSALTEALTRRKALIINQEAVTDDGHSFIAFSSLVVPVKDGQECEALLFRKGGSPFQIDGHDLKSLETFARLSALILRRGESRRVDATHRMNFQKVLSLLRFDPAASGSDDWSILSRHLGDILPPRSATVVFVKERDRLYRARESWPSSRDRLAGLDIGLEDLGLAWTAGNYEPVSFFGQPEVSRRLAMLRLPVREAFQGLFQDHRQPNFMTACPFVEGTEIVAVALVFLFDLSESDRGDWERLIMLAAGVYSVRRQVGRLLTPKSESLGMDVSHTDDLDSIINRLNNHLSAVIGNAELASVSPGLPETTKDQVQKVISEAELAARYLRESYGRMRSNVSTVTAVSSGGAGLNHIVESCLQACHVSENLYMVAGAPREINIALSPVTGAEMSDTAVRRLVEQALSHFASLAPAEEIIDVSTYRRDRHLYLDISRHQRNFPVVEPVAGFGDYRPASEVFRQRPHDAFLQHIAGQNAAYAFDRFNRAPAYISFRFPARSEITASAPVASHRATVLAIDDQPVILDLISAMCRSLGYEALTASTGEEGVIIASRRAVDIVLVDLAMPGISGLEVARRIRAISPEVPIVLVTGWEASISHSELQQAGISQVLNKPFRIEQLTEIFQSAIASPSVL